MANFEPDKFLDVQAQFYDHQPAELTNGLTNSQILGLIGDASATTSSVTSCVNKESYKAWVTRATQRVLNVAALSDPSTGEFGTPVLGADGVGAGCTTGLPRD